ncbi:MAG: transcriptional regulator [Rhodospirillales bacterium]|nr:transcriptional regulator [Rhodospirillales bacterium]
MANPIPLRSRTREIISGRSAGDHSDKQGLGTTVAQNLKRLRSRSNLSLEQLAKLSGVSRAMLSQIELGRSVPSINVAFKIARAFGVPFSALLTERQKPKVRVMPAAESKILRSASGEFSTRALFPVDAERKAEFYELRLAPGCTENAEAHAAGTLENLVVASGLIEINIEGETHRLSPGDAVLFQADSPHSYSNSSKTEALLYLVMTYKSSTL